MAGAVVEQVREAILTALEAHGADLSGLDPRESVTVAVDFVGSGALARRPRVRRTLVVRVSLAELQARLDGKLTPAEFRQRVQARRVLKREALYPGARRAGRRHSISSVTTASVPSLSANSRNARGEPCMKWSSTNRAAPSPLASTPAIQK